VYVCTPSAEQVQIALSSSVHGGAQSTLPLQQPAPAQAQLPRLRGASAQPPQSPPEPSMSIGAFSVTPSALVIAPGERARISVTLRAEGSRMCSEKLILDVSDRCETSPCPSEFLPVTFQGT